MRALSLHPARPRALPPPARPTARAPPARRPMRPAAASAPGSGGCPLGFGGEGEPTEPTTLPSKVADSLTPSNLADLPRPTGERWLPVVGETVAHAKNHLEWAHKR